MFKKIIIGMVVIMFMFTGVSFADQNMSHGQWKKQQKQLHRDYRNKQKRGLNHYGQGFRYQYHGHRHWRPKHYRGHWRSWQEWNSYRSHNHHMYQHGHYYRHNGSLYFQFRSPDGIFVFSIGR